MKWLAGCDPRETPADSKAEFAGACIVCLAALLLAGCSRGEPSQGSPAKPDEPPSHTGSDQTGESEPLVSRERVPSGQTSGARPPAIVELGAKTLEQMRANRPKNGSPFRLRGRITKVTPNVYESRSYSDDTYVQKQSFTVSSLAGYRPLVRGSSVTCYLKDVTVPFPARTEQEVVLQGNVRRIGPFIRLEDCVIISFGEVPKGIPATISIGTEKLQTLRAVANSVEQKLKKNDAVEQVRNWGDFGITVNKFSNVDDLREIANELNKYPLGIELTLEGPYTTEALAILSKIERITDLSLLDRNWAELNLDSLRQLKHLDRLSIYRADGMSDRHLVSVSKYQSLRSLSMHDLKNARLTVTGWEAIAEIPWLRAIYETIAVPAEDLATLMPKFQRLRTAHLKVDKLTDGAFLTACTDLTNLSVSGASISTDGIIGLSKCKSLRDLTLWECKIEGELRFAPSTGLEDLELSACQVRDGAFPGLQKATSLTHVSVSETTVSTQNLVDLSKCKSLVGLRVYRCKVEGDGPLLDQSSRLESLEFSRSQVSDAALESLPGPASLKKISFEYCEQISVEAQQAVKDRLAARQQK